MEIIGGLLAVPVGVIGRATISETNSVQKMYDYWTGVRGAKGAKDGWFKMIDPDAGKSQQFLLNKQGGEHLPMIKNIEVLDKR